MRSGCGVGEVDVGGRDGVDLVFAGWSPTGDASDVHALCLQDI